MSAWKGLPCCFDIPESGRTRRVDEPCNVCPEGRLKPGYRLLAPGEMDSETLERAAEIVDEQIGPNAIADAIRALKGGYKI